MRKTQILQCLLEKIKKALCSWGIHSFKTEELPYSVLRRCRRCPHLEYLNMHPAANKRWLVCSKEYEQVLRTWKF